jgi:hypothetical protein
MVKMSFPLNRALPRGRPSPDIEAATWSVAPFNGTTRPNKPDTGSGKIPPGPAKQNQINPNKIAWFYLVLLGFIRPNRDFSGAYDQSKLNFFLFRRLGHGCRSRPVGRAWLVHDHPHLLEVFTRRRSHDFVDAEVGGDPADLVEQLLARIGVIDLVGAGDRLVAVAGRAP